MTGANRRVVLAVGALALVDALAWAYQAGKLPGFVAQNQGPAVTRPNGPGGGQVVTVTAAKVRQAVFGGFDKMLVEIRQALQAQRSFIVDACARTISVWIAAVICFPSAKVRRSVSGTAQSSLSICATSISAAGPAPRSATSFTRHTNFCIAQPPKGVGA